MGGPVGPPTPVSDHPVDPDAVGSPSRPPRRTPTRGTVTETGAEVPTDRGRKEGGGGPLTPVPHVEEVRRTWTTPFVVGTGPRGRKRVLQGVPLTVPGQRGVTVPTTVTGSGTVLVGVRRFPVRVLLPQSETSSPCPPGRPRVGLGTLGSRPTGGRGVLPVRVLRGCRAQTDDEERARVT